jgi:PAS domain S-box-containing protein
MPWSRSSGCVFKIHANGTLMTKSVPEPLDEAGAPARGADADKGTAGPPDGQPASTADVSVRELEHIRYALDQSAIVATTDVTGRIKFVNDKFCEISKYSRNELIGQDHRILNSGYHGKEYIRGLWRTIAWGHIWRGDLRNRAKDGSLYWVDTTIVPFLDERRKPWQYTAIRYDITERKRQEQQLRDQAALTNLGEMAAVVAHEVRNPLAGIRGAVQVIGALLPSGSDGTELIGEIVARIDSLNSVMGDLLAYARQRELRLSRVDVATFLLDLASFIKQDALMENVELEVPEDSGIVIDADLDQLRLVFTNLLLNAAQAMNERGRITLRSTPIDNGGCVITVEDEGPGIPDDLRQKVFEAFFTTKHRGTGLGLPTARRLIEAHGGRLELLERPGGGTIMQVTLPRPGGA